MKKVKASIFSLHRIIGTIVCLFFFMWCISGLILIYHAFPNVSSSQTYANMDALPDSLPNVKFVLKQLSIPPKSIKKINLRYFQDQVVFTVKTKDSLFQLCADSNQNVKPITWQTIETITKKWVDAPVVQIDTLNERDIWIMYSRYEKEMPIYKFYFDDVEKHQLYISSRTGEVQQLTNSEQRFWAWVGSIPHKFYIPILRKHTDNWILALTIGGAAALIASVSGICVGLFAICRRYKIKGKVEIPYKKYWYKWHLVAGFIFGIALISFAFSGTMAMQKIPQWAIKIHGDYRVSDSKLRGNRLSLDAYILDYSKLKIKYTDIKSIEWSHFRDIPIYNIVVGDKSLSIDASSPEVKELYLPQSEIEKAITDIYGENTSYSVSLINEYEEYYLSRKKNLPLPAYKVEVNNADESRYYIDPKTGDFKYLNRSSKAKKWVFSGLHYLNIKYLIERPVLRTILIWTLCLGSAFVSLSGIYLGFRYTIRKIKHVQKILKRK